METKKKKVHNRKRETEYKGEKNILYNRNQKIGV